MRGPCQAASGLATWGWRAPTAAVDGSRQRHPTKLDHHALLPPPTGCHCAPCPQRGDAQHAQRGGRGAPRLVGAVNHIDRYTPPRAQPRERSHPQPQQQHHQQQQLRRQQLQLQQQRAFQWRGFQR
jgi:hypothetical protein